MEGTFTIQSNGIASANFRVLERRARAMTDEALLHTIKDAREASAAMPEGYKAGFYEDEAHVCSDELRRRAKC